MSSELRPGMVFQFFDGETRTVWMFLEVSSAPNEFLWLEEGRIRETFSLKRDALFVDYWLERGHVRLA